jgi:kynurenine formamidase
MQSAALLNEFTQAIATGALDVIDLTQTLSEDTPALVLPPEFGQCVGFSRKEVSRYDARGVAWYWNEFTVNEHTGTHFDAPIHWVTGKDLPNNAVDTIAPAGFIGPACVVDKTKACAANSDYLLTRADLETWEAENGRIPEGAWLLFRTGWSRRAGEAYTNRREDGAHTPGPDVSAVQFMVERGVRGFGVETIGTDAGQAHLMDPMYPAHTLLHGAGRFGLQCLTNLEALPTVGATVIAAPLKIRQGSGSPLRVLALVPR